jgi:hypothetical protein
MLKKIRGQKNGEQKVLRLNVETLRSMTGAEAGAVVGGGTETSNCPTRFTCGKVCTENCSALTQ